MSRVDYCDRCGGTRDVRRITFAADLEHLPGKFNDRQDLCRECRKTLRSTLDDFLASGDGKTERLGVGKAARVSPGKENE